MFWNRIPPVTTGNSRRHELTRRAVDSLRVDEKETAAGAQAVGALGSAGGQSEFGETGGERGAATLDREKRVLALGTRASIGWGFRASCAARRQQRVFRKTRWCNSNICQ